MAIRCIALDLDRTTLDGEGRLSPATRAAVGDVIRSGREVIIASGRPFAALPEEVAALPGIRYAITSNGAAVYALPGGRRVLHHPLTGAAVDAVLSVVRAAVAEEKAACEALEDGVPFCSAAYYADPTAYGATEWGAGYVRRTRRPQPDILGFIRARRESRLDGVNLMLADPALRRRLWDELRQRAPAVYLTASADNFIEIADGRGGKENALKELLERLGIRPEETAAFGDADNDARMLAFVGAGVAVANATPLCRQAADYLTDSHDRDGVAKWLRGVLPTLEHPAV